MFHEKNLEGNNLTLRLALCCLVNTGNMNSGIEKINSWNSVEQCLLLSFV